MKIECDRCGLQCLSAFAFEKALERGKTPLCADCQQLEKPLYRVQGVDDYCVPHQGHFDSDDWPLNNDGLRIFTDLGLCGYSDCVKPAHHAEAQVVEYRQPKHPRRKGFVKPAPKRLGRPPKLVVKERINLKRANAQVFDFAVIMALAEVQDFNHRTKKVSS
jgi:hypothetical protein